METWPQFAAVLFLLLCNALLVACELSLIKLRFSHFNPALLDRLRETPRLASLMDHADLAVRVIRFGIIGCLIAYTLVFFPWLRDLAVVLGWIGEAGERSALLFAGSFVMALSLQHLCGELIPRGLGLQYPARSLRSGYWLVRLLTWFLRPLLGLLNLLAKRTLRIFGADTTNDLESLDMEVQIELLGEGAHASSEVIQSILRNALKLRGLVVSDILLPRHQVQYLDLNDPLEANLELTRQTGHTRFPLCQGDLDRCIGLIHIKDIFRQGGDPKRLDLRRIRRTILRFSPQDPLELVLPRLLGQKTHMGLVVDEFGGTQGIVTLEGILEELVGDIQDEFDAEEEEIQAVGEGRYLISGLTPIHELEGTFGIEISNEDVSTFSGLITSELGRIPDKGEELALEGMEIHIDEVDEKRVIAATVQKIDTSDEA